MLLANSSHRSTVIAMSVFLGLLLAAADGHAAVVTEGDAEVNFGIHVAQNNGDGSVTITAPTVLQGGGIFIAGGGH